MATSGTVDRTKINVATLIDTAFRRCGKAPSTVSGELLEAAQNALFFLLSELVNEGINLFCIRKSILGSLPRTPQFELPSGTTDVLDVLYRTVQNLAGTVESEDGTSLGVNFVTPVTPALVSGVMGEPGALTARFVIEYKNSDRWLFYSYSDELEIEKGAAFAFDMPNTAVPSARWRVRDSKGGTVAAVRFGMIRQEQEMTKIGRDDYIRLPDKFRTGKSLQYWFDKQIEPVLHVWPLSPNLDDQIIVYQHGQIEDIGRLTNELAVPTRWYEAVIFTLASRLVLEIPPAEVPPGRYEILSASAATYTQRAGRGESDGAPLRLSPQIRGYTR